MDSSSSSSQHYSALLATVSELRIDLERTVSKLHTLEVVNKELTGSYETVKEELLETRKKYLEAQENYQKTATAKIEGDKINSLFVDKMKQQLNDKTKEFEALREKFIPQDIDYIRIKVQEEIEIPHRQKVSLLEAEIERQKDLYFSMRRESERYKADYEYYSQAQQREVSSIRAEHEAELQSLRDQLVRMQSRDTQSEREEKIRSQQIRIQELQRTCDILRQEKETLVVERDAATVNLIQLKASSEQVSSQLRAQLAVVTAEKQAMDSRIETHVAEAENKDAQLRSMRQQLDDVQSSLEHKTEQLLEREHFISSMREDRQDESEKVRMRHEGEMAGKDGEIETLLHRLGEREEYLRRIQKEASDMQVRAEATEGEMRRGHLVRVGEMKQRIETLELENAVLKKDVQMAVLQRGEMNDKFSKETDVLRSEVSRLKREKEVLLSRNTTLEQAVDAERRKFTSAKRLSSAKGAMSSDLLLEMKTRAADLEQKVQEAREKEIKASGDLRTMEEVLSHKEKEFSSSMESMQREAHSRYEQLGKEYKEQLEHVKAQAQRAVAKERRRSEGYKEKALEAHQRSKLLSAVIAAGGGGLGTTTEE